MIEDTILIKKVCSKCNKNKILSEFRKSKLGKYGFRSDCKQCEKDYSQSVEGKEKRNNWKRNYNKRKDRKEYNRNYSKEYRKSDKFNIEREKEWRRIYLKTKKGEEIKLKSRLKQRYNLSLDEYDLMLREQPDCNICKVNFSNDVKPNIDHCHKTGRVRSLLCRSCNVGIGKYGESESLLLKLIEYLEKEFDLHKISYLPEKLTNLSNRRHRVKKEYNITLEEYYGYFYQVGNKCQICDSEKILCLDHCHKTNKIRGILCVNCNTGLANLKEDKNIITEAIKYIERYK